MTMTKDFTIIKILELHVNGTLDAEQTKEMIKRAVTDKKREWIDDADLPKDTTVIKGSKLDQYLQTAKKRGISIDEDDEDEDDENDENDEDDEDDENDEENNQLNKLIKLFNKL